MTDNDFDPMTWDIRPGDLVTHDRMGLAPVILVDDDTLIVEGAHGPMLMERDTVVEVRRNGQRWSTATDEVQHSGDGSSTVLDELRARAQAATSDGPWHAQGSQVLSVDGTLIAAIRDHSDDQPRPDAAYIAAVSPDVILELPERLEIAEAKTATEGRTS